MATDAIAAPSAATDLVIPTGAGYSDWRKTGSVDSAPPKENAAAPAAAEVKDEKDSSAAGEIPAESAPAPDAGKAQEQKPDRRKPDAEHRIGQLVAETKSLKAELAAARAQLSSTTPTKPAEPSPAKAEGMEAPKEPVEAEYDGSPGKTYEDFRKAERKYYSELAEYKADQRLQRYQQDQARQAAQKELDGKLAEARKRYPDLEEKIVPASKTLNDDPEIHGAVKHLVNVSPVLPDVLYVMAGDEANFRDFVETAKHDPVAAIRKFVLLERLVMDELAGKTASPETGRDASGKFVKGEAPEKKVTGAPPPPKEVSGKSPPPADEVQSAVESEDFQSYRRSANSRDLAKKR